MKNFFLALIVVTVSINAFAAENWATWITGFQPANTYKEYLRLKASHPDQFPEEVSEEDFQFAGLESYNWYYTGSTICEPNDIRLEVQTFRKHLCTFHGCTSGEANPQPASESDPCL